jgi:hypothetical protein
VSWKRRRRDSNPQGRLSPPHFECGALPVRTTPPWRQDRRFQSSVRNPAPLVQSGSNRGARIRTGDLCDPNAALYRTEPRPVFFPALPRGNPRGWVPILPRMRFRCLSASGRGGIRTHAGLHPHDFQSCALSHSATRPDARVFDTEGWARKKVERPGSPHLAVCFANPTHATSAPFGVATEGVGFEPTRAFRPNALAGRRLKPLGHPSGELPLLGSNQDSPDPESGVLPITPRGNESFFGQCCTGR